jgi:hypothetical protein
MGGLGAFSEQLAAVKNDDYRGFKFKAMSVEGALKRRVTENLQ